MDQVAIEDFVPIKKKISLIEKIKPYSIITWQGGHMGINKTLGKKFVGFDYLEFSQHEHQLLLTLYQGELNENSPAMLVHISHGYGIPASLGVSQLTEEIYGCQKILDLGHMKYKFQALMIDKSHFLLDLDKPLMKNQAGAAWEQKLLREPE